MTLIPPGKEEKLPITPSFSECSSDRENTRRISVLYVDDNPSLVDIICRYLRKHGEMQADSSLSVEEAVNKMRDISYDVIITDYNSKDGSGNTLLSYLRHQDNQVPFVYFLLSRSEETEAEARQFGGVTFVDKIVIGEGSAWSNLYQAIRDAAKSEKNASFSPHETMESDSGSYLDDLGSLYR